MTLPDLTNYLIFARVVEAGSISAGARLLQMPKSTISRKLTQLEEEQGIRLLYRNTRGLKLTDVGEAFLVHCQAMIAAAEAAQQVTQRVRETPRGTIHVSSPYALSQSFLTKLLPLFMQRYPEVVIDLKVTNRPVNLLDEGVDVALRVRPEIEDSSLIARPLADSPLTLYAAPSLLAQVGAPEHPLDLIKFAHLSLHYTSGRYRYQLKHSGGEQLSININPRLITDDMIVLREAAMQGDGIVALPTYLCAEAVAANQLARVLPDWQLPMGILHLVYPHRKGLLPAVRVFVDFLVETLPPLADKLLVKSH